MIQEHLWETDAYIDYDIISQQYEEAMGSMKADLTILLTKDPLTSTDLDQVR